MPPSVRGHGKEWKPDPYVVARVIDTLLRNGPMKRSNLQLRARLNYEELARYVELMRRRGLLAVNRENEGELLALTEKGHHTNEAFLEWSDDVLGCGGPSESSA